MKLVTCLLHFDCQMEAGGYEWLVSQGPPSWNDFWLGCGTIFSISVKLITHCGRLRNQNPCLNGQVGKCCGKEMTRSKMICSHFSRSTPSCKNLLRRKKIAAGVCSWSCKVHWLMIDWQQHSNKWQCQLPSFCNSLQCLWCTAELPCNAFVFGIMMTFSVQWILTRQWNPWTRQEAKSGHMTNGCHPQQCPPSLAIAKGSSFADKWIVCQWNDGVMAIDGKNWVQGGLQVTKGTQNMAVNGKMQWITTMAANNGTTKGNRPWGYGPRKGNPHCNHLIWQTMEVFLMPLQEQLSRMRSVWAGFCMCSSFCLKCSMPQWLGGLQPVHLPKLLGGGLESAMLALECTLQRMKSLMRNFISATWGTMNVAKCPLIHLTVCVFRILFSLT